MRHSMSNPPGAAARKRMDARSRNLSATMALYDEYLALARKAGGRVLDFGALRTKAQIQRQIDQLRRAMKPTLTDVRAQLRTVGVSISHRSDWNEYRVNYRGGREATAYYTDDLEDALGTGKLMAEQQGRSVAHLLPRAVTDHIVARVSGVTETDSRIEAANKAIATMKMAGFPLSAIRKAVAMRDAAIKRGVK